MRILHNIKTGTSVARRQMHRRNLTSHPTTPAQFTTIGQTRLYSNVQTKLPPSSRRDPPRPHFWKTWSRPILKILLPAFFVYQVTYLGWSHLYLDIMKDDHEERARELKRQVLEEQKRQGQLQAKTVTKTVAK